MKGNIDLLKLLIFSYLPRMTNRLPTIRQNWGLDVSRRRAN